MASSLRRCSDEELQKALADIDELVARRPIPDEFKFPDPEEEQKTKEKEVKKNEKKKKKKKYILPPEDVDMLLSYECEEFPPMDEINEVAKEEKGDWEDLRIAVSALQVCGRHYQEGICATQEWVRHQLLTKGCVTYEATDDEAEEEVAEQQGARGGGGRRRHRPGVAKIAVGRVRKLT